MQPYNNRPVGLGPWRANYADSGNSGARYAIIQTLETINERLAD